MLDFGDRSAFLCFLQGGTATSSGSFSLRSPSVFTLALGVVALRLSALELEVGLVSAFTVVVDTGVGTWRVSVERAKAAGGRLASRRPILL